MKKILKENFQYIINISKCVYIILVVSAISVGTTGSYFSDTATIANNVISTGDFSQTTPRVVINEVYYDTGCRTFDNGNCSRFEDEDKNEWIELYNPTDLAVNIKNWTISNNSQTRTINPNISIPAYGFALLTHDNDTWHFWGDPGGENIVKINFSGSYNRLSNIDDRVILKDNFGKIVDHMSYGDDISAFDPACIDVEEGHSLERSPLGVDTDSATDFVERAIPTPGT